MIWFERLKMVFNFIMSFEWITFGTFLVGLFAVILLLVNILGWACGI